MILQNSLSLFLALRYIRHTAAGSSLSFMVKVCFLSIVLGTFSLTLVTAIMNGFEKATHQKLQTIHADIIIKSPTGQPINYPKLEHVIQKEFPSSIVALSPTSFAEVLIKSDKSNRSQLAILKGINPQEESQVSAIASMVIEPTTIPWPKLFTEHTIIIGQELARQLQVTLSDTITLLLPDDYSTGTKITLTPQEVTVSGIIKTGINEFDERLIYCSLELFNTLFSNGITEVGVKLAQKNQEQYIIQAFKKLLNLDIYSWKELYPALIAALTLEKYAMVFILTLVILIASMNIISLLFMFITQKQRDIAILKAMGMTDAQINYIFIILGIGITTTASFVGTIFAILACIVLNRYPFITLPDVYYVTHLPVALTWQIVFLAIVITLIISFLASWIAVRNINKTNTVDILKHTPL